MQYPVFRKGISEALNHNLNTNTAYRLRQIIGIKIQKSRIKCQEITNIKFDNKNKRVYQRKRSNRSFLALQMGQISGGLSRAQR
jgi:hypothetical protein